MSLGIFFLQLPEPEILCFFLGTSMFTFLLQWVRLGKLTLNAISTDSLPIPLILVIWIFVIYWGKFSSKPIWKLRNNYTLVCLEASRHKLKCSSKMKPITRKRKTSSKQPIPTSFYEHKAFLEVSEILALIYQVGFGPFGRSRLGTEIYCSTRTTRLLGTEDQLIQLLCPFCSFYNCLCSNPLT